MVRLIRSLEKRDDGLDFSNSSGVGKIELGYLGGKIGWIWG